MTLAELRAKLEEYPREGLVPVGWVLEQLPDREDVTSYVDGPRAAEITGMKPVTLRSRASRWWGTKSPQIRVTKKDPANPGSHWLYHEGDCWAYARGHGSAGPRGVEGVDEGVDEKEATIRHWERVATENL